ncbi:MAG TPA: hypothetical protein PKE63_11065 [Lacibacter sp.]|nr:hypothetical protein [Lacibacter sp.]HMO88448.1 hypothetical protein [Lacibacter sp.]HMP87810.1 hypothetical protein [Lacibacter sp.]
MDRKRIENFLLLLLINSTIAIAVFYVMDQFIWKNPDRALGSTLLRAFVVALVLTLFQSRKKTNR